MYIRCSGYWPRRLKSLRKHARPNDSICCTQKKAHGLIIGESTRDPNHIEDDFESRQVYKREISSPPVHNHLSHELPTFRLGTSGYAGSPKTPRRYIPYIGTVCGDSPQRDRWLTKTRRVWFTLTTSATINVRDQQHELQQQGLDLNATANKATGSGNANTDSGGVQNGQPPPHNPNHGNRQSAFDRIGPSGPTRRPFGGIGSDESHIA
ncbi:hypothetical protein PIB30_057606 [Stylosanthes scabra]|uniref:Uncharacterized protein n=1 Tax=Stylosanthes scabra TaxID=79078 RepID=A0ABU6XKR1_9FABA|nr:hypothetical protein [Stylosanthes scabra]